MSLTTTAEIQDSNQGISLADIPIDRNYELPTAGGASSERASALLSQFDRKRRAAALAVPTSDADVRARLRSRGQPITLFGEGPADRRDRLRDLMLQEQDEGAEVSDVQMNDARDEPDVEEEFYTEGSPGLLQARKTIAEYSLTRARARIQRQKEDANIPLRTHKKHRQAIRERLGGFDLYGTQIAGDRPVSICRFAPDGKTIAAGNWSGGVKLLSVPDLEEKMTWRGHTGKVGGISWRPGATLPSSGISETTLNLASGGENLDGSNTVNLYSLTQDTPLHTLDGHSGRVCRVEFHPSGKYLASASFDTTWRLWDLETTSELLLQEGHSREVYAVSFNTDGSLLASGGFDSIGRIWDLRSGRTAMILEGHIREIYSLDWGIDGYRVLSGSGDGWVKCWDLRAVRQIGQVGAHNGNVADLRWFKGLDGEKSTIPAANHDTTMLDDSDAKTLGSGFSTRTDPQPRKAGTFFVSAGFDKQVNVFSADDWSLAKQLSGHSGNVLSCDVSEDARWIASCGHDRTVKLWGRDDGLGI